MCDYTFNYKSQKCDKIKKEKHPLKLSRKWKDVRAGSLTRLHPGALPLISYASSFAFLFWFLTFFVSFFHSFLCTLFPLPHLPPFCVPCNATDGLCERWGRSQRISIYLTRACPSSSSHSLIYHTQVPLIVVWRPAPGPGFGSSLWAPVIITLGLCWE